MPDYSKPITPNDLFGLFDKLQAEVTIAQDAKHYETAHALNQTSKAINDWIRELTRAKK